MKLKEFRALMKLLGAERALTPLVKYLYFLREEGQLVYYRWDNVSRGVYKTTNNLSGPARWELYIQDLRDEKAR